MNPEDVEVALIGACIEQAAEGWLLAALCSPATVAGLRRDLAELERDQRREWERHAAAREAGEAAYQRAMERRLAEPGEASRWPVAACMDWAKPKKPVIG